MSPFSPVRCLDFEWVLKDSAGVQGGQIKVMFHLKILHRPRGTSAGGPNPLAKSICDVIEMHLLAWNEHSQGTSGEAV